MRYLLRRTDIIYCRKILITQTNTIQAIYAKGSGCGVEGERVSPKQNKTKQKGNKTPSKHDATILGIGQGVESGRVKTDKNNNNNNNNLPLPTNHNHPNTNPNH